MEQKKHNTDVHDRRERNEENFFVGVNRLSCPVLLHQFIIGHTRTPGNNRDKYILSERWPFISEICLFLSPDLCFKAVFLVVVLFLSRPDLLQNLLKRALTLLYLHSRQAFLLYITSMHARLSTVMF